MECYDAASEMWRAVSAMGEARRDFAMCELAGDLYVCGGIVNTGPSSSVTRYTPSTYTWSAVAVMPELNAMHNACAVDESIYGMSGFSTSVFRYDSNADSWSEVAPMPESRIWMRVLWEPTCTSLME